MFKDLEDALSYAQFTLTYHRELQMKRLVEHCTNGGSINSFTGDAAEFDADSYYHALYGVVEAIAEHLEQSKKSVVSRIFPKK